MILSLFNINKEIRKIYSARRRTSETQLQDEAREDILARDPNWSLLKKILLKISMRSMYCTRSFMSIGDHYFGHHRALRGKWEFHDVEKRLTIISLS